MTVPGLKPEGLSSNDLHRLAATLAIWVALVLGIELSPLSRTPVEPARAEP